MNASQTYQLEKLRLLTQLVVGSLFGIAAILYSVQPATADAAPSTISESGRYQMQFQAVYDHSNSYNYFYILVWDSTSGRSKMYYGSTKKGLIKAAGSSYNLPSSPL